MAIEIWDAYDANGNLTGKKIIRGETLAYGVYHLVSDILVRHVDGTYLIVQRSLNKEIYPGLYEASAGGSALQGENAYETAVRELEEETGITTDKLELITSGKGRNSIYYQYLCVTDCPKDGIILQKEEAISYRWMSLEELIEFVRSEQYVPSHRERIIPYLERQRRQN